MFVYVALFSVPVGFAEVESWFVLAMLLIVFPLFGYGQIEKPGNVFGVR
jgi:hypothetical protein